MYLIPDWLIMKYYTMTLFCAFTLLLNAQTVTNSSVEPDSRLYDVYESTYIDQLLTANPFLIQRWNFYLDHAYDVIEEVSAKTTEYPSITISDIEHINILLLEKQQGLTHDFDHPTVYRISNTNKLLVYKPGKEFNELLKAHLKKVEE